MLTQIVLELALTLERMLIFGKSVLSFTIASSFVSMISLIHEQEEFYLLESLKPVLYFAK